MFRQRRTLREQRALFRLCIVQRIEHPVRLRQDGAAMCGNQPMASIRQANQTMAALGIQQGEQLRGRLRRRGAR